MAGCPAGDTTETTLATVNRFNEAIAASDLDTAVSLLTDDTIFENTNPAPDGERLVGAETVKAFFQKMFSTNQHARFDQEEIFAAGERCTVRWTYHWIDGDGQPGHIRGVDVIRVRDGLISEAMSYVKG